MFAAVLLTLTLLSPAGLTPPPIEILGPIEMPPGVELSVAVRLTPIVAVADPPVPQPPAFSDVAVGDRCIGAEPLLAYYSPGWDVIRMSRIMHRESAGPGNPRCDPRAYNRWGRAHGLLQITPITFGFLSRQLGVTITSEWLFDPVNNIQAAAALWREDGYSPWKL